MTAGVELGESLTSAPVRRGTVSPMGRVGCLVLLGLLCGCTGEIGGVGGTDPDDPDPREALPFAPVTAAMQRLTVAQYESSVTDVLGAGLTMPEILEPDTTLNGFVSIGASRTTISPRGVESYEEAAYDLAGQALAPERRDSLVTCDPSATCTETFVRDVGGRLWRRPLTEAEVARYVGVAQNVESTLGDFWAGLEFALAGFLQSPNFLFRVELGEPDGDIRRYTDYEMASRLSYVLWNTTPDDLLLEAAARGELTTDEGLRAQVDRLLASDRSREAVRNFFAELLVLDDLDSVEKSTETYPQFTESFRASAREETLRLIEHLTFELDADYRELFTTDITFVDAQLAEHYGLVGGESVGFSEVSLPPERRGLLGHASILSIYAHDEKTSAALRGRFVRQVLLCGTIPPPPPEVSTVFPPSSAPTLRERVAQHLMNDGCSSCHSLMDPIGLGLENFDAIGAWRDTENGATIDPSGEVDEVFFTDGADLGRVVADHPDLGQCITRNFFRYAVGETESGPHFGEIGDITDTLEESGYRLRVMIAEMMMSRSFREAGEPAR